MTDQDRALPATQDRAGGLRPEPDKPSQPKALIPSAVRGLTESGDFYSGTPEAWARYRAAVNAGDWAEVMRLEEGQYGDFRYDP